MRSITKMVETLVLVLFSVTVGELKISGVELPATVAPAEPILNDRFHLFVWDNDAQNALLLYIFNTQSSTEVD